MKYRKKDIAYLGLPLMLWPLSFVLLGSEFIYAMAASTLALAAFSLYAYGGAIHWGKGALAAVCAGAFGAAFLYLLFYLGGLASATLGIGSLVQSIYATIYSQTSKAALFVLLALIGLSEEIYWRGGVQGYLRLHSRAFRRAPWLPAAAYYSLVHIVTLNPVLVSAALVVGLVTGTLAQKYGIAASSIAHIAWLEAVVLFAPVMFPG